jgi:hypothetical protein
MARFLAVLGVPAAQCAARPRRRTDAPLRSVQKPDSVEFSAGGSTEVPLAFENAAPLGPME